MKHKWRKLVSSFSCWVNLLIHHDTSYYVVTQAQSDLSKEKSLSVHRAKLTMWAYETKMCTWQSKNLLRKLHCTTPLCEKCLLMTRDASRLPPSNLSGKASHWKVTVTLHFQAGLAWSGHTCWIYPTSCCPSSVSSSSSGSAHSKLVPFAV